MMLTPSQCFLLSNHRDMEQPMNTVNIQGSSLFWETTQLIKVGLCCWLWLERYPDAGFLQGVWAWGAAKRLISQERTMSVFYGTWKQLHRLDTVGFCESGLGAHVWAHVLWFWSSMCVCFLRLCFPLTQCKSTVNCLNTSHHHWTLFTYYLTLPSTKPFLKFG